MISDREFMRKFASDVARNETATWLKTKLHARVYDMRKHGAGGSTYIATYELMKAHLNTYGKISVDSMNAYLNGYTTETIERVRRGLELEVLPSKLKSDRRDPEGPTYPTELQFFRSLRPYLNSPTLLGGKIRIYLDKSPIKEKHAREILKTLRIHTQRFKSPIGVELFELMLERAVHQEKYYAEHGSQFSNALVKTKTIQEWMLRFNG